jgi:hypothetical protein
MLEIIRWYWMRIRVGIVVFDWETGVAYALRAQE